MSQTAQTLIVKLVNYKIPESLENIQSSQKYQLKIFGMYDTAQLCFSTTYVMCILFGYVNNDATDGEYQVVIASNRDEYYTRPTSVASCRAVDNGTIICGKWNTTCR